MIVGVGASRVRDLFEQAKKVAPSIIFIDELDAIGRARGGGVNFGGHDEREQTLNQILTEMDGFTGNEGVVVLAATNRPEILDPALLRPGRFDRRIVVNRPTATVGGASSRCTPRRAAGRPVSLDHIASTTSGMVGAELKDLVNEAALLAARRQHEKVERVDFADALETDRARRRPQDHDLARGEARDGVPRVGMRCSACSLSGPTPSARSRSSRAGGRSA